MRRFSARHHLLGLIAAAVVPVWLFTAYLLSQYAQNERARFDRDAMQVARQVSLVVEGELARLETMINGLAKSAAFASGDLATLHAEASRLVEGTGLTILLRDLERQQIINTRLPHGTVLPLAVALLPDELERLRSGRSIVTGVYPSPISKDYRIAVAIPVPGPAGQIWSLAVSASTDSIHEALLPAVPEGWTVAVGDRVGSYVARSRQHEELTGKPGLPEYIAKVVGRSGTFTSRNLEGMTLLAGYYRSEASGWFYTANVPLSVVQGPFWRSLSAIGAVGLLALIVSLVLAYVVGKGFARAAGELASRADALGKGLAVTPVSTTVEEFSVIGEALIEAERALAKRAFELQTVLDTAPVAVWFTYDPQARQVIRNRFAAELMGLTDVERSFDAPDFVIDTIAWKSGQLVAREDRPLSRAMRGERTDNEEFVYILPNGLERTLLTSAHPIHDSSQKIIGAVQISLDISERKRGEEHRKLLANELNHRVKNTLAVVQSIAGQTLRNASSLAEAGRALSSRLVSLAKAHDILTQENWSGADLKELVTASVRVSAELERFELSGDAVWLPPATALSLSLAFHELATNAIKYGALSTEAGTVAIAWSAGLKPAGKTVRIAWRERGGPSIVPTDRKGFGLRMLDKVFDPDSSGSVTVTFEPIGVVCVFELTLPA